MYFNWDPVEGCNVFEYIKYMNYMSVFIAFVN